MAKHKHALDADVRGFRWVVRVLGIEISGKPRTEINTEDLMRSSLSYSKNALFDGIYVKAGTRLERPME